MCHESMYNKKINIAFAFGLLIITIACKTKSNNLFNRKHNYHYQILHEDYKLDRIINSEKAINSDYFLKESIRSLHTINFNSKSERERSTKYYYNSKKEISRKTTYDSELIAENDEWYYKYTLFGVPVIKRAFYHVSNTEIKSFDDQINKILVLKTFQDNIQIATDSLFYEREYYPKKIISINSKNQIVYKNIYEYQKNKTSLNLVARKINYHVGIKRVYDKNDRFLYINDLMNIDFNTLSYDIGYGKREVITWDGDNFRYESDTGNVYRYNSDLNKLRKIFYSNITDTYFSENLRPLFSNHMNENEKLHHQIIYKYNDYEDLILKTYKDSNTSYEKARYKYVYDENNNWIKKEIFLNGILFGWTIREINYY